MVQKIVIFLFFMLASFSIAFSAQTDVNDVNTVVKIWKEVQVYVDKSEFSYWFTNDHHMKNIVNILNNNGIFDEDKYVVAVMGDATGKPVAVVISLEINGTEYTHYFMVKKVKPKGKSDPGCNEPGNCA